MSTRLPIEELKRYVYIHLAIAGIIALALGYATMQHPVWERVLVPLYMLALSAIILMTATGRPLKEVERLGIGSTALYFLLITVFNSYALGSQPGIWPPLLWGGLVYLFAYVLLPPHAADVFNFVYFALLLTSSLIALQLGHRGHQLGHEQMNDLLQIYLSNLAYLWVTRLFLAFALQAEAEREHARRLQQLADTDSLTGAFSRRRFLELMGAAIENLGDGGVFSFILLDLDNFKEINDTHGHPVGDKVLIRCAKRIRHNLRDDDVLGRLGGEEFGILLPNVGLTEAEKLADRLRQSIEAPADDAPAVTASFGVVEARSDCTISGLLTRADRALYRAKWAGKNRVYASGDETAP